MFVKKREWDRIQEQLQEYRKREAEQYSHREHVHALTRMLALHVLFSNLLYSHDCMMSLMLHKYPKCNPLRNAVISFRNRTKSTIETVDNVARKCHKAYWNDLSNSDHDEAREILKPYEFLNLEMFDLQHEINKLIGLLDKDYEYCTENGMYEKLIPPEKEPYDLRREWDEHGFHF